VAADSQNMHNGWRGGGGFISVSLFCQLCIHEMRLQRRDGITIPSYTRADTAATRSLCLHEEEQREIDSSPLTGAVLESSTSLAIRVETGVEGFVTAHSQGIRHLKGHWLFPDHASHL